MLLIKNFKKIDIFGTQPCLLIDKEKEYKSCIGGIFTFLLVIIVLTTFWVYGSDIYYKENPKVSFAENF